MLWQRHRELMFIGNIEMCKSCFAHLREKNIDYCKHFRQAFSFSWEMLKCVPKMWVHAIYPDAYQTAGTEMCTKIITTANPNVEIRHMDQKKPY